MEQQYAFPGALGTTYVITENPPIGAQLVTGSQTSSSASSNGQTLDQRVKALEKEVSNINERLGVTDGNSSFNYDEASKALESTASSASNEAAESSANDALNNAASAASTATTPIDSSTAASTSVTPIDSSGSASVDSTAATPSAMSGSASTTSSASPSTDDIASQLSSLS